MLKVMSFVYRTIYLFFSSFFPHSATIFILVNFSSLQRHEQKIWVYCNQLFWVVCVYVDMQYWAQVSFRDMMWWIGWALLFLPSHATLFSTVFKHMVLNIIFFPFTPLSLPLSVIWEAVSCVLMLDPCYTRSVLLKHLFCFSLCLSLRSRFPDSVWFCRSGFPYTGPHRCWFDIRLILLGFPHAAAICAAVQQALHLPGYVLNSSR